MGSMCCKLNLGSDSQFKAAAVVEAPDPARNGGEVEADNLTPLGNACLRKILEILESSGYKDDEGIANEIAYCRCTDEMKESQTFKKKGDLAFKQRDCREAIDSYTQFINAGNTVSPTIYARRSLSFLLAQRPHEALTDAIKAQVLSPKWYVASYLGAVALAKLGKESEAQAALKEGRNLEAQNLF